MFNLTRRNVELLGQLLDTWSPGLFGNNVSDFFGTHVPLDPQNRITIDMPGFNKEDINVTVSASGLLRITARTGDRTFNRTVQIAHGSGSIEVTAKYENGVLTVTVPGTESSARTVSVQ